MPRPRVEGHLLRSRGPDNSQRYNAPDAGDITFGTAVRENTIPTSGVASVVPSAGKSPAPRQGISTAVGIQLLFLALFVIGIVTFLVQRRRSYKRQLQNRQKVRHISCISAPNGLDPGPMGNVPPTYQEALKSPMITVSSASASMHQRQRSDEALMDQCWSAVYQAEEGGGPEHNGRSTISDERSEPATPRVVTLRNSRRQSLSQWLLQQLKGSTSRSRDGPLSSNPPRSPPSVNLPVPPSPTYTGIPVTPTASAPQSPTSATHLHSPYPEPLSARSWVTGEDVLSIRASIPRSVLYPSALQPAPPPRRSNGARGDSESVSSVDAYGAGTWRTLTPHDDPPEYEPRRGDPDSVSPL